MSLYAKSKRFEPIAIVGIVVTALLHVGTIAGVLLYRRALEAAEKPPPPPSFVVAKLIRKGRKKDPKKLPDKIVPRAATRKAKAIDLSADADAAPNKRRRDRSRAKLADRQRDALAKLDALAKAQKEIEAEGDPQGVVGGSSSARAGDRYMTRIADLWNRTWSLPTVIPREKRSKLYVLVIIDIDKDGNIKYPIKVKRRSGNQHFDSSVIVAWNSIKKIPIPPPDRLAAILANGMALKLTWKGMR